MSEPADYTFITLLFGLPMAVYPYRIAKFNEMMDAIGSKRDSSEIEPADWNVTLTRIVGIGLTLFGLLALIAGLTG